MKNTIVERTLQEALEFFIPELRKAAELAFSDYLADKKERKLKKLREYNNKYYRQRAKINRHEKRLMDKYLNEPYVIELIEEIK